MEEVRIREVYRRRLPGDAQQYSSSNPVNAYFVRAIEQGLSRLLVRHYRANLALARILDIGCGNGAWLRHFMRFGARSMNLTGVDLMPEIIAQARVMCPPDVNLLCGSAAALHFPDNEFDIVCQSMVLSSVLDEWTRKRIASEMLRVLKPNGLVVSFDFFIKNPRNPDTCRIGRQELKRLFPGCLIDSYKVILAPPVARLVAPYSLFLTHLLESVSLFRGYYLSAISSAD